MTQHFEGTVRNVVAFGPRAGRPLRKIVLPAAASSAPPRHESRGVAGFDLAVGPVIRASDRSRLERLCRYALRPTVAADRLEELIIATVTNPTAVKAILECLGLPGRPPPVAPPRKPEQVELGFEG